MTMNEIMKNTLSLLLLALCPMSMSAQNPLITNQFTADPTARVFNNRVFVFPSHDIISPVEPEKKWFSMADYHVFSSTDLSEWSDHGVILSQEQVPWGNPKGYSMWAPDCVEKDGKYYFFFPDAPKEGRGFGIGVAIADRPFGPYKPVEKNIEGVMGIDPCVLQASDGNAYLFWGGGGLVVAKLKDNLLELDGKPERITTLPEGFKEGPFAFERNGKYYLTYPWVRKEKGTETLAYAMSDNPMGPYEYKGLIMEESATGCWTNHHSIVDYNGQWYLFYHHNDYSPSFDKNRSICCDSLFFNADGTIQLVKPTLRGVGITDARKPVQIDRYSEIGGGAAIEYHDTLNYFQGWKTVFPKGGYVRYNKVEVKGEGAKNVCLKVKTRANASAVLELLDGKTSYKMTVKLPSTDGAWQEVNVPVKAVAAGVYDLRFTAKADMEVDWLSLTAEPKETYFTPATDALMTPDADGFIRRWMLLEPIDKPNRSNVVFTDTYLREHLTKEYFSGEFSVLPKDGDKVTVEGKRLTWHALESNRFNVKLFRFATGLDKQVYGVLFCAVTVIDCDEDIENVRLAVGSNSASMWWLNGKEAVLLSGDRRMVKDDCISPRLTLKKGRNILRGVVINGPGMSDFCVRFIDEKGEPVKNCRITLK